MIFSIPFTILQLSFFNHSLLAVRTAREKLEKAGESIKRPTDYFCEHVKSDAHMARVCILGSLVVL